MAVPIYEEVTGAENTLLFSFFTHSHHFNEELLQRALYLLLPLFDFFLLDGWEVSDSLDDVIEFYIFVELELMSVLLDVLKILCSAH